MPDQFSNHADQVSAPATRAVAVVPHDSNALADTPKALFVGTGGNITMRGVNGSIDQLWEERAEREPVAVPRELCAGDRDHCGRSSGALLMLGLSIPEVARRRTGLDTAAAALLARMSMTPSAARAGLVDALVRALKAAGVWAKLELLYVTAAHDAQAARLNWVQDAYNLSAVNAPAFAADRAYASDGTTSYLDTGYNPVAANLPVNGCAMGVWCRDEAGGAGTSFGSRAGGGTNSALYLTPRTTSNTALGRMNQGITTSVSAASGAGLTLFDRSGSAVVRAYRNGVDIGGDTGASNGRPSQSLYLCARNSLGAAEAFDTRQIAMAVLAKASLTAGEHVALHAAAHAYLAAVGAA